MNYIGIGDTIDYDDYNAIVYLLRKFKRLNSNLKLGKNTIISDYGTYNFTGGLTNVGGNYIIESVVNISSTDVLLNCYYTFNFNVIDVNTSGTVNKRIVSVTCFTGDEGILSINILPDIIESDEVILSDFTVDIVFDEHEYYTPIGDLNIVLNVEKEFIIAGEINTINLTVTDDSGNGKSGLNMNINVNGEDIPVVLDDEGKASITYIGTGNAGKVYVKVNTETIIFYDGGLALEYNAEKIRFTSILGDEWLITNGDALIDWGDGTRDIINNPNYTLAHDYMDGQSEHTINIVGDITGIGNHCFYRMFGLTSVHIPSTVSSLGKGSFSHTSLTSVNIPESVIKISDYCFDNCRDLTSVTIPNSVVDMGYDCFRECVLLEEYQLYWEDEYIIPYSISKFFDSSYSSFFVPEGEAVNYVFKGYPSSKIHERSMPHYELSLYGDSIISKDDDTYVIAILSDDGVVVSGETLNYEIKHGDTVLDSGSGITNSNGQITINYTGTGVGDIDVVVTYGNLLQETFAIEDCYHFDLSTYSSNHTYDWSLPSTFKIEFEMLITKANDNSCMVRIGEGESRVILTGKVVSSDSVYKTVVRTNSSGSGDITTTGSSITFSNDFQSHLITFDGTTYNYNNDINITDFNGINLEKLVSFSSWKSGTVSGQIRNVKVKAL